MARRTVQNLGAAPVEAAWGGKAVSAAERVRLSTLEDLTGIEDEAELVVIREGLIRHAAEMVWAGRDTDDWRKVWDDFWETYGEEILGEEYKDTVDAIEFDYESYGPDKKNPESGLSVEVRGGNATITQWDLTPPPDDPQMMEAWKDMPVLKMSTEVDLHDLLDQEGKHRGSYSGDGGESLVTVAFMPKEAQQRAVVAAAISWMGTHGGDEMYVEAVGRSG